MNHDGSAEIGFEFFGISREDAEPVINELRRVSPRVVVREFPTPPAASPLFSEFSVLLIALSTLAGTWFTKVFFEELGKGLAHDLLAAIHTAMGKAKRVKEGRGGFVFGVRVDRENSEVFFQCSDQASTDVLEKALPQIPDLLESVPNGEFAEFRLDPEHGIWSGPELASREVKQFLLTNMEARRKQGDAEL